jgi:hypothetical protein
MILIFIYSIKNHVWPMFLFLLLGLTSSFAGKSMGMLLGPSGKRTETK